MNTDQARYNMIEQQIRPWDVLDQQVLDLLTLIPREQFVPKERQSLAFADAPLPFGDTHTHPSQVMLEPKLEARLIQTLRLEPHHHVLVVGAGLGYVVALAAQQAKSVVAYEKDSYVAECARTNLSNANIENVTIHTGDGLIPNTTTEFDRILLTGSITTLPKSLIRVLAVNGECLAVVGTPPIMQATRFNDKGEAIEEVFDTFIPKLETTESETFIF